jgi:prepilin peptidase CpaA
VPRIDPIQPHHILLLLVVAAFYRDVGEGKIPNVLTVGGSAAGFIYHVVADGWQGAVFALAGFAAGFITLLALYVFGALGAGDVKLFGAIGAISGMQFVLYSAVYSILFAGFIGVVILLFKKQFWRNIVQLMHGFFHLLILRDISALRTTRRRETTTFPFMYAVLPGVISSYVYLL